jgi:hypothetical protein
MRDKFDRELKKAGFWEHPTLRVRDLFHGDGIAMIGEAFDSQLKQAIASDLISNEDAILRKKLEAISNKYTARFNKEISPYIKEDEAKNGVQFGFG